MRRHSCSGTGIPWVQTTLHPYRKEESSLRLLRIGGMTDWVAVILGLLLMVAVKSGLIARVPW